MKFEIITIFPGFFAGIFEHGIVRRAQAEGLVTVGVHDLRAFTHDRHRTVDGPAFGAVVKTTHIHYPEWIPILDSQLRASIHPNASIRARR